MQSNWNDEEAATVVKKYTDQGISEDLALRTYSAQLIGSDPALVLHGGGNTSVKSRMLDITQQEVDVLHIKGSGWDLGTIEPPGHPAVRLEGLMPLRKLEKLSDEDMVNVQRINLLDSGSPNPSVECLLHAFLPHKFIDHTHADAILSIVNLPNSEEVIKEIYGDEVAIVPYIMPGFDLAKLAAEVYEKDTSVKGMLLLHHGIFSFADNAKESYEIMIDLVDRAEKYCETKMNNHVASSTYSEEAAKTKYLELAPVLRGALSIETGSSGEAWKRFVFDFRSNEKIHNFLDRSDLADITAKGPGTPDHVIRTKQKPIIINTIDDVLPAVDSYRRAYHQYFVDSVAELGIERKELDSSPRVILIPGAGIVGVGATTEAAGIAADLYEHTVDIINGADAVGDYTPLNTLNLFDMEYWGLEQAKLGKKAPATLEGQVVLITGAASGIGAETTRVFSKQGAHLVLWDIDKEGLDSTLSSLGNKKRAISSIVDVTNEAEVQEGFKKIVMAFGGLDIVISNAGKVWNSELSQCDLELLDKSFSLNFKSHHLIAKEAVKIMKLQNNGGSLLFNASKSTFNPGPKMGPYTLPKAAVVSLMKQYAVEYGEFGIRSNAINADRINTNLFTEGMLEKRAAARGLTVDEYLRGNLLKREVTAQDVGQGFLALTLAYKTTGTVMPVDGGNIAASPR